MTATIAFVRWQTQAVLTRCKAIIRFEAGKSAIDSTDRPRTHVTVINTTYGKPFTVDGYSRFKRDTITAAGLPMECQPHGLRKTLGRLLADAGATAHETMAALGYTTLAEAECYTRDADRRRGGQAAIAKLDRLGIRVAQTTISSLGKVPKKEGESKRTEARWRSLRDSNPCFSLERATSQASRCFCHPQAKSMSFFQLLFR